MRRAITGRFDGPGQVLVFGFGGLLLAGALFVGAWSLYPPENGYAFLRKSASYLGSFDERRNPDGWWLFSIGLFALGLVTLGAARFRHRALRPLIDPPWPLHLATGAFLGGGVLFILLGLVPDARSAWIGPWNMNDIHDTLAAIIFWCLGIGMASDGLMLWGEVRENGSTRLDVRRLKRPYLAFAAVGLVAGISLLVWHVRCRLDASLQEWPGEGIYSFPMWEWILTFAGPLTLVGAAWALAKAPPRIGPPRGDAADEDGVKTT